MNKKKMAINLTPQQMQQANWKGLLVYGLSCVGMLILMLTDRCFSIIPTIVMVVAMAINLVLVVKKGQEDKTKTMMAVVYVITYAICYFTIHTTIYPIVFVVVFALTIYQNVRLVKCGAYGSLVIHAAGIIISLVSGDALTGVFPEIISTLLCTYLSVQTAKTIYFATAENMTVIEKKTKTAVNVADQVSIIAEEISDSFQHIIADMERITGQATENKDALQNISQASETNSAEIQHQSEMTQNIYAVVQETEATATKVQQNAIEVAETVADGAVLSEDMKEHSKEVTKGINATYDVVQELVNQIQGVTSITDAILSISGQTNLLALNASIEAARAGEAGKGFAVVADEIRSLAEQTRLSTEEITEIMNRLVNIANSSVATLDECVNGISVQNGKIDEVNASFEETRANVEGLKEMVDGIIESVSEVSKHTAVIVDSVISVTDNTSQVATLSENGVQGADIIYNTVEEFAQTIRSLNEKVEELREVVEA